MRVRLRARARARACVYGIKVYRQTVDNCNNVSCGRKFLRVSSGYLAALFVHRFVKLAKFQFGETAYAASASENRKAELFMPLFRRQQILHTLCTLVAQYYASR